ncbi:MAG TPA: hypothetical protein VIK89_03360 [Cytophagaceae bacterium]
MSKPVRLNTRVSQNLNDWLDKKSSEMGVSKSALVAMAVENYRMQFETVDFIPGLLKKLDEMGIDLKDYASERSTK